MWNHQPVAVAEETRTSAADRPVTNDRLSGSVAHAAYSQVASFLPQWDLERLEVVYRRLVSSGFYFGRMSIGEATERLGRWPVGSFLLRDSSDPRYLFSVSIQTCRGTTSIRMAYRSGLFRLDCSPDQEHLMPTFDCALRLVSHYVRLCAASVASAAASSSTADPRNNAQTPTRNVHSYVLLESSGRKDTPVLLTRPYRDQPSALAHLCRRTIHSRLTLGGCGDSGRDAAVDRLHLIPSLKTYLKDYPHDI
jgi:suppressor of cytokine signaling 2